MEMKEEEKKRGEKEERGISSSEDYEMKRSL